MKSQKESSWTRCMWAQNPDSYWLCMSLINMWVSTYSAVAVSLNAKSPQNITTRGWTLTWRVVLIALVGVERLSFVCEQHHLGAAQILKGGWDMAEGSRFTLPSLGLSSEADLNYLVAATADSFTDITTSRVFPGFCHWLRTQELFRKTPGCVARRGMLRHSATSTVQI